MGTHMGMGAPIGHFSGPEHWDWDATWSSSDLRMMLSYFLLELETDSSMELMLMVTWLING